MILLTAIEYLRDDSILTEETFTSNSSKRGSVSAQIMDIPMSAKFSVEDKETIDAWPDQRRQKNGKTVLFTGLKALGNTIQSFKTNLFSTLHSQNILCRKEDCASSCFHCCFHLPWNRCQNLLLSVF